ncbi:MAG: cupredoxin domain-containing protein [bacterium]|nr:cupredoxin domain-containing protein [bacterium]
MKNTYIVFIILIVVVGGFLWWSQGQKAEAPAQTDVTVTENVTPTPEEEIVTEPEAAPVKEFVVEGKNFAFVPSTLTVKKGDRVKITFKNTQGFHDFKIDSYGVATVQKQAPFEEVLEFTADKAGSFEYYCSVGEHKAMGMVGTLKVAE